MPSGVYQRTKQYCENLSKAIVERHKNPTKLMLIGRRKQAQKIKGRISVFKDKHHSIESKEKIRLANINKKLTSSHKKNIGLGLRHSKKFRKTMQSLEHRKKLSEFQKGEKHHNWKGEKRVAKNGYVLIRYDGVRGSRIYEHQFVIMQCIGRIPKYPEASHHVNEVKTDNQVHNLMLFKNQLAHKRFHRLGDAGVKPEEIVFDGRTWPFRGKFATERPR